MGFCTEPTEQVLNECLMAVGSDQWLSSSQRQVLGTIQAYAF